jgi:hypothetical protein
MANLALNFRGTIVTDQSLKQILGSILHERGKEPNFDSEEGQVEILVPDGWSEEEVSVFAEGILKELIDAGAY